MLKFLSPLLLPGRSLIARSAAGLIHQPMKFYSQEPATPVSVQESQQKDHLQTTNEPEDVEKLYSRLEIELRGSDPAVMKSYSKFVLATANHLEIEVGKCWDQRKPHKERLTLLKSAFVHKKHRVQYEIRTYFKFMHFHKLTGSTLSTYLEYIERNLPEGVALKATKVEVMELPEHLWQPPAEVKTDDVKQ